MVGAQEYCGRQEYWGRVGAFSLTTPTNSTRC